jgi:hypothetical protein
MYSQIGYKIMINGKKQKNLKLSPVTVSDMNDNVSVNIYQKNTSIDSIKMKYKRINILRSIEHIK